MKKIGLIFILAGLLLFAVLGIKNFEKKAIGKFALNNQAAAESGDILTGQAGGLLRSIRNIKLDLRILKSAKFLNLIQYGQSPQVAERGRSNPFEAY
ncbi:MAG: hypothetical protein PHQ47_00995 [Candidatus Portnoybacteria bacterium]|nr:hypothetical protein [Candidatus Portnoybacteria bacterium]